MKIVVFLQIFILMLIPKPISAYKNEQKPNNANKDACSVTKRNPYNGWIWAGVGFLYVAESMTHYVVVPMMDYQLGVGKSFWNFTPYTFLYFALIADFAYSDRNLGSSNGLNHHMIYYFSSGQGVLGYEQSFGTQYLTGFLEAGVVFQERVLAIEHNDKATMDQHITVQPGGTFNVGLNIRIVPDNTVSYLFRLGMNLMVGVPNNDLFRLNLQVHNINPITYSPSVSFGLRM